MASISPRSSSSSCSSAISSSTSLPSTPNSPPTNHPAAAFVPFLWEEKPGVSKQINAANPSPSPKPSSHLLQLFMDDVQIFPLPTPPRLQNPPRAHEPKKASGSACPAAGNCNEQKKPPLARHTRKLKVEDDPFLMAIQECTKNEGVSESPGRKHSRTTLIQWLFENEDEQSPRNCNGRSVFRSHSFGVDDSAGFSLRHQRAPQQAFAGQEQVEKLVGVQQGQWFATSPRAKSERFLSVPRLIKNGMNDGLPLPALDETVTAAAASPARLSFGTFGSFGSVHPVQLLSMEEIKPPTSKEPAPNARPRQPQSVRQHRRANSYSIVGNRHNMLASCLGCRNAESYDSIVRRPHHTIV